MAVDSLKVNLLKYYGTDAIGQVYSVRRVSRGNPTDHILYRVWIGGERLDCHSYVAPHFRNIGDSLSFKYLNVYHKICKPTDEIFNSTLPDPAK